MVFVVSLEWFLSPSSTERELTSNDYQFLIIVFMIWLFSTQRIQDDDGHKFMLIF